jgi:uncharacterized protein YidB (DUF937 family)
MGLLDGIVGNALGSAAGGAQAGQDPLSTILSGLGGAGQGQGSSLLTTVMSMLQQNGGLGGVLDMFRQNGMAQQADSWVGTGANMDISGNQVEQVFGNSALGGIASQLGMSNSQAGAAIARLLPELINQLTPQGRVPDNQQDLLAKGLSMLRGV